MEWRLQLSYWSPFGGELLANFEGMNLSQYDICINIAFSVFLLFVFCYMFICSLFCCFLNVECAPMMCRLSRYGHFSFPCSPPAIERLSSGLFQEVIITNTIPVLEQKSFPQLTVLSVANLLGETIWRVHDDSSVSSIFQWHDYWEIIFNF